MDISIKYNLVPKILEGIASIDIEDIRRYCSYDIYDMVAWGYLAYTIRILTNFKPK